MARRESREPCQQCAVTVWRGYRTVFVLNITATGHVRRHDPRRTRLRENLPRRVMSATARCFPVEGRSHRAPSGGRTRRAGVHGGSAAVGSRRGWPGMVRRATIPATVLVAGTRPTRLHRRGLPRSTDLEQCAQLALVDLVYVLVATHCLALISDLPPSSPCCAFRRRAVNCLVGQTCRLHRRCGDGIECQATSVAIDRGSGRQLRVAMAFGYAALARRRIASVPAAGGGRSAELAHCGRRRCPSRSVSWLTR